MAMSTRETRASACAVESLEDRKLFSTVVGVSGPNQLVFFDTAAPNKALLTTKVKGLARRESIVGIDFRPSNGGLYAIGSTSQLYRIDTTTGQATAVGSGAFDPLLAGEEFGFDFNPAVDAVRVVSEGEQNLRLNADTGAAFDFDPIVVGTQSDLALAYGSGDVNFNRNPEVTAIAYSNSVAGGTPTTLYGLDSDVNALVRIGSPDGSPDSPNNGVLTTIGALNVEIEELNGFDIVSDGGTDVAYAGLATSSRGRSELYTIDLTTGAATRVGEVPGRKRPLTALAVAPAGNLVYSLDKKNTLYTSSVVLPSITLNKAKVQGLERREKLVSIDRRPSTGVVYGFTDQSRLYTIDPASGAATAVGGEAQFEAARRATVAIDFNPAADRLRVVDSAGENLRIDPATGQVIDFDPALADVQLDGPLVFDSTDSNSQKTPYVTGIGYTNAVSGATTTTLFAIDTKLDALITVGSTNGVISPDTGRLFTVGSLGVNAKNEAGFDIITPAGDLAYAAFQAGNGPASLYTIDLTTGAATEVGRLGKGVKPIAIAVVPVVPQPA